jgi:serine/threonine protein kinase
MRELAPGDEFAGYVIEGLAGKGGMGVVYRARQEGLDRLVALKLIAPDFAQDPAFRDRFKRESRTAASIEHPNVIPLYEAGEHDGQLFISMRFVEGDDLKTVIVRDGGLAPEQAVQLLSQVASALDAAHARGLVHRDIKPGKVLIADSDHAYLTDFGLTKHLSASSAGMTATGMWVGTLDYVAPEQVSGGTVDARSDVYSLGCVLFQMLTGRVPYERDSDVAKLWAHMHDPPPSLTETKPEVPAALQAVVERAMA